MASFAARVDGEPTPLVVQPDGLVLGDEVVAWVDLDRWDAVDRRIEVATHDGRVWTISHLATSHDGFVREGLGARARARRAALLQWTGDAPIADFDAKRGDERVRVMVFADGLTVEPVNGVPDVVPLSCLERVERDGYDLTLVVRGLPGVRIRHLANRTDEFLERLDRARVALSKRTSAAYAELDPTLAGLPAHDGWAIDRATAAGSWAVLRDAVAGQARGEELALLGDLAGARLRLGIKCGPGNATMPFALAPVGDRVAVEATDADARATFVFATDDVDRLNAVLLATSFRREAISLPDDRLGRWALAVRSLEVVRWARAALVARVVHDSAWADRVRQALTGR